MAGRHRPREHRHQFVLVAVLAHEHGRQLLADLHQVGQIGDVVLRDQVVHHADALQARAHTQRLGHLGGLDAGHFGDGGVGFGRVAHLELHQQRAQVSLVARQRAVKQQGPLGPVELQHAGQRVDVLLDQGGLFLERLGQPLARGGQHAEQVFGQVLGVLVQVEEQRAFLIRAAPGAVARQKFGVAQRFMALPEFVVLAAPLQETAQALQRGQGPDQVASRQREQAVEVAPHIELGALPGRQGQHELRAHQIEQGGVLEPWRQQHALLVGERTLAHGDPS